LKILQKIFFGLALLFIPLTIVLDRIGGVSQPVLFFLAAVAIFPWRPCWSMPLKNWRPTLGTPSAAS